MKKTFLNLALMIALGISLTSCYTVTQKNHYVVYGLAGIKTADPTKMAGDAKDYEVTTTHSFIDGLLNLLTGGLYTPTTTTVKK